MAKDGPKMAKHDPNMTPRRPESDLKIIKKTRKTQVYASEMHCDTEMTHNGTKLAPRWPQDGPKMAQNGPRGLNWAVLGPSCGNLGPSGGQVGVIFSHLGAIFGHLEAMLGLSRTILPPKPKSLKTAGKLIFLLVECSLTPRWRQVGPDLDPRWPRDGPRWPQGPQLDRLGAVLRQS